jgi:hypothetical protein
VLKACTETGTDWMLSSLRRAVTTMVSAFISELAVDGCCCASAGATIANARIDADIIIEYLEDFIPFPLFTSEYMFSF